MTDESTRHEVPAVVEADRLFEVAHARAGDKGNTSNIVVVPFDDAAYPALQDLVTEARVAEHFGELVTGDVTRYAVDELACFNFVLEDALAGGVTRSLRVDRHGKTLSRHLLRLPLHVHESD